MHLFQKRNPGLKNSGYEGEKHRERVWRVLDGIYVL